MRLMFLFLYIPIFIISCAGPNVYISNQEPTHPFSQSVLFVKLLDSDIKIDFPLYTKGDTDNRLGSVQNIVKSRIENLRAVKPVFKKVVYDTSHAPISTEQVKYKTRSKKGIVFSVPDSNTQIRMGEAVPEYVLLLSEIGLEPKIDTLVGSSGDLEIEHYRSYIMAKVKYLLWDNNAGRTLYCGIEKMNSRQTKGTLLSFDDCLNMIDALFIDIVTKDFIH